MGATRTGSPRATCSAPAPRSRRRSRRASAPTSPRSKQVAERRRGARRGTRARRRRRRPARRSRAATASSRRRTSCAASSPTTGCSKPARAARPRRVRRDGVPVAPGPRRVPRVRQRGRAGRRRASTIAGRRATGCRSCSTSATTSPRSVAGDAALRRAAREPDQGRPQPRGQGRPGGQPPRRPAVPVAGGRRVRGAARRPSLAVHPYDIEQCAAALDDRARDAARRTSERSRRSCVHSRRRARRRLARRPGRARARSVSGAATPDPRRQGARPARRVRRRRVDRARERVRRLRRPHADPARASRAGRRRPRAPSAANAGRSPVSSPANAATAKPSISASAAVPLSIATGGRSSTAIARPELVEPVPRAEVARRPRAPRRRARARSASASVTLTPAFRSTIAPARRSSASSAAAATAARKGTTRGSTRRSPSIDLLHAVQPDVDQPGHRRGAQRGSRRAGRSRSPTRPDAAHQRTRAPRSPAAADGVFGAVHDRRQRAVEVERGATVAVGLLDERVDRCVGVEHGATLPGMDAKAAAASRPSNRERARHSSALSHRIHAHPELKFEEEQSSAWTAGVARRRRARRSRSGSATCRPRSRARSAADRCTSRSARSTTRCRASGTRAGTTSSRRPRSAPALALAPLVDDLGLTRQRHRHARRRRRRRQDLPARTRRVRRRARGDDGAPDAVRRPRPARQRGRALRVSRTRPRVARGSRARARHQRGRRDHRRAGRDRACCASTSARDDQVHGIVTHGGDAPNIVPAHTEGIVDGARADHRRPRSDCGPRVERCFEAGALATGATLDDRRRGARRTHTWSTTTTFVEVYRANAVALGRRARRRARVDVLDRHGQRVARRSRRSIRASRSRAAARSTISPSSRPRAINASADRAVLEGALAMAWTAIDVATGPLRALLRRVD